VVKGQRPTTPGMPKSPSRCPTVCRGADLLPRLASEAESWTTSGSRAFRRPPVQPVSPGDDQGLKRATYTSCPAGPAGTWFDSPNMAAEKLKEAKKTGNRSE